MFGQVPKDLERFMLAMEKISSGVELWNLSMIPRKTRPATNTPIQTIPATELCQNQLFLLNLQLKNGQFSTSQ